MLDDAETAIDQSVIPAFLNLSAYLKQQERSATDEVGVWKFPNGEDYYAYALRHHSTTELTAEEIHEIESFINKYSISDYYELIETYFSNAPKIFWWQDIVSLNKFHKVRL